MTPGIDRPLLFERYRSAGKRTLFLDYDGTLVPFHDLPEISVAGKEVRQIIRGLASDERNRVYIISGRPGKFLSNQFRGIRTGLIAEHGYKVKKANGKWTSAIPANMDWKKEASALLHTITAIYPGSFIEEKESSLACHYRNAVSGAGKKIRVSIREQVLQLKHRYSFLELLEGNKVMEVKPGGYDKGQAASSILKEERSDFILAAGDDLTDEQLFAGLSPGSFTIKVGGGETRARFRVATQEGFIEILKELQQVSFAGEVS
jgi:trehalose 6-phosphate synthase/phosphatase